MRARRGIALPVTLLCLAVIGLFVAGTAFVASQEGRAALALMAQRQALEAAEYGAAAVLRDWNPGWVTGVGVGGTVGPLTHALSGGASSVVRLTRITETVWWVVSDGRAGGALVGRGARRVVNVILRLDVPAESASVPGVTPDSIRRARLAASPPVRVRDRWWAEFD